MPHPETPGSPNIVLIGGGSGCATLYPEIVAHTPNATAIVSMSDSGGSTGEISNQLDILPVGDLRNVMQAASTIEEVRSLRSHRFGGSGNLKGHTWGNVTVAACIDEYGIERGVDVASKIFQVPGTILPVTLERHELAMADGDVRIYGEHNIDEYVTESPNPKVWLQPEATINPRAEKAIAEADLVVIAAGSVYTSLLAALTTRGVKEALEAARARKVLVSNLVTETHQTDAWHVADYVQALQRHDISVDAVLYNTEAPTQEMLDNYAAEGERPVDFSPERFAGISRVRAIGAALLDTTGLVRNPNDPIKRALIRHNPTAVREELWKLLDNQAMR